MSITKCPGHMRRLKLNFSATVLTLGLKGKIFENLRLCQAKFWGELRTRATFDRCVVTESMWEFATLEDCNKDPCVRLFFAGCFLLLPRENEKPDTQVISAASHFLFSSLICVQVSN